MFTTSHAELDDVVLHFGAAGPEDGTPVLFLHGWPDLWFTWEGQMRALAERGYRVIAPDQRGYGRSSKPTRVRDYRLEAVGADMVQFIAKLSLGPVHVVGHDWGGMVAWWLAIHHPQLVRSLTVTNAPHPMVFLKGLLRPSQLLRCWYMFVFQVPGLAERLFEANDSAALSKLLARGAHIADPALLARYREQWRNPGAVRMPLYWYRAMFRYLFSSSPAPLMRPVSVPTLLLWGDRDPVFVRSSAQRSIERCVEGQLVHFDTEHWPYHEQPERFSAALREWLAQHAGA